MDPSQARVRVWPAAIAVGTLSLLLGAITLGRKALWYDEAFNAHHIQDSWRDLALVVRTTEMSQGAYMVGLKLWTTAVPDSETWLRIPSVAFAALAAALLVPLGSRLFDRPTGIIAGVLLATNAFLVRHAQEARTYALVTLAVIVASILFLRALDDPRRRTWLLYAFAAAAAVYCHFYAGFVIVAHIASIPFAPQRPPWRRVLEAGALFVVLIVPAVTFTVRAPRSQLSWISDPSRQLIQRILDMSTGRNLLLGAAVVVGLVVLAHQARNGGRVQRWRLAFVGGWCAFPLLLGLVVSQIQPILVIRYSIVMTPALALVAAYALATAMEKQRVLAIGALVALLAVSGYRLADWYTSVPEDWRGAASYIARERRAGDAVVLSPSWAFDAYHHYDARQRVDEAVGEQRTFLVLYQGSASQRSERADALVDQNVLRVVSEERFGDSLYVRVYEPRDQELESE